MGKEFCSPTSRCLCSGPPLCSPGNFSSISECLNVSSLSSHNDTETETVFNSVRIWSWYKTRPCFGYTIHVDKFYQQDRRTQFFSLAQPFITGPLSSKEFLLRDIGPWTIPSMFNEVSKVCGVIIESINDTGYFDQFETFKCQIFDGRVSSLLNYLGLMMLH